jgi:molecular chaperone DnaJ
MSKRDYYEVLELTKPSTSDEIKKKYRKLAMTHHPDKGGDEAIFKEIVEAYEVLSDKDKKAKYDKYGHEGPQQQFGHDAMSEFLRRNGFARNGQRIAKGSNMNLTVKLTLEEIYGGVTKKFKYVRKVECSGCDNKGGTGAKQCDSCQGSGMVIEVITTPFGQIRNATECNSCGGQGTTYETMCNTCAGEGVVDKEELIDVNVPSGVIDNMMFGMEGKGNAVKNGVAGDLIITIIELRHDKFVRNGNDIKIKVPLNYYQLILGDKTEIQTIDGGKIRVTINKFTKVNEILRVQGKGLKHLNSDTRGDMLLEIDLIVDDKISDKEIEIIKELKNIKENIATE